MGSCNPRSGLDKITLAVLHYIRVHDVAAWFEMIFQVLPGCAPSKIPHIAPSALGKRLVLRGVLRLRLVHAYVP